jgi:cell wall-associated NlpC family hydrolase
MQIVVRILSVLLIAGTWAGWEVLERLTPATTSQEPFSATIALKPAWTTDVLAGLGNESPTANTVAFLEAWARAENTQAAFNPLATTQGAEGSTMFNCLNPACTVGVRNYPDYATGVRATVETLTNGFYPRTLAGLVSNQPTVDDGEMGVWGTGGGAVRAQLEEAPHAAPSSTRAELVSYALSLVGMPYVRGGRSATGGDCSGTMQHVYLHVTGLDIGGTTFSQWPQLQAVDSPEPGDLAYFAGFSDGDEHVGMVADVDGDGALDLINNGGHQAAMHVDYSYMDDPYFNQHFKGYRRAL